VITALAFATVCIFIRCVFRVAELSDGFNGKLANQQESFMVLEGLMMVLAAIALTIYNPGRSFQGKWASTNFSFRHGSKTESDSSA
jgi:predicted transporter